MPAVEVDLTGCADEAALWSRLLAALGAPDWHGRNLDALWDGLTGSLFPRPAALVVRGRVPALEVRLSAILTVFDRAGIPVRRDG